MNINIDCSRSMERRLEDGFAYGIKIDVTTHQSQLGDMQIDCELVYGTNGDNIDIHIYSPD